MFTVEGELAGRAVTVEWQGPDQLDGDASVIAGARALVRVGTMLEPSPTSELVRASLADPLPALLTLEAVLDEGSGGRATGDVPTLESVPGRIY